MTHSLAHEFHLTPGAAEPWNPPEPTEAERIAIDRCYALAKAMGLLERLIILRALQQQINEGPKESML